MPTAKQPTILIIDDERQHLTMQSLILKEAGFRPITVVVGSQSLSLPDHDPPDLILLDYRLNSILNCQQVAQLLRQRFRGTPIVLVSSMQEMPAEMKPLVDSFLRKGNPEDLIALVNTMLGRSSGTSG
jgi:two-component system, OmpR family, phosphate regulon response regulator PhoB